MSSSDPHTSVPVHASTVRLLQQFKTGAQNWDQFLVDLLEREMDRDDLGYAQKLLEGYRRGTVRAVSRSAAGAARKSRVRI